MTTQYEISYQDHDQNANGGKMVRQGKERAEQCARLMRECGYQTVIVTPIA